MCERPYSHILSLVYYFFIIHLLLFKVQTFSSFLIRPWVSQCSLLLLFPSSPFLFSFIFFLFFFTSFVLERYRDSSWKKKKKCWGMRVQPCRMPHATSPRVRHRGNDSAATPMLPKSSLQSDSSHSHAKGWPLFYTQSMKNKNRMHNLKLGILLTFKFICLYTIF